MPTTDHYTSTNNQPEAEFITPIKQAQQSPTKLLQTSSGSSSRFSVTPLSNECNDDEDHHHQQRTSPVKQTTAAKQPSVEETPTVTQQTLGTHKFCREFRDRYEIKDLLGEGGFGFVVSATREGSDEQVAVKFILKDKVPIASYIKDPESGKSIPFEVYVLKRARHPNIVKLIEWFEDSRFYYVITELHGHEWIPSSRVVRTVSGDLIRQRPSLDLFECIDAHERFTEKTAKFVFKQIVNAIHYLQSELNICHRDVKDENIVIDKNYNVKLVDFGAAAFIPTGDKRLFTTFHGTVQYCPPEIIRQEKYRGPEAEVWALGVLLYTMLFGENPFNDPKNILDDDVSIFDLAAECGCTVYIGGKLLVSSASGTSVSPSATCSSSLNNKKGGMTAADIDQLQDQLHRSKISTTSSSTSTNTTVIRLSLSVMDLLSRMLRRDPKRRITIRQVVNDLWMV